MPHVVLHVQPCCQAWQRKLDLTNEPGEDVLLDVELLGDVADGGAVGDDGHEEDGERLVERVAHVNPE